MISIKDGKILDGSHRAKAANHLHGYFTDQKGDKYSFYGDKVLQYPLVVILPNGSMQGDNYSALCLLRTRWIWAKYKDEVCRVRFSTEHSWEVVRPTAKVEDPCECDDEYTCHHCLHEASYEDVDIEVGCKICREESVPLDKEGWCEDCQNIELDAAEQRNRDRIASEQES